MKRFICLVFSLMLLCGCAEFNANKDDTVTFYYCSSSGLYAPEYGIICTETVSKKNADSLEHLLDQYFSGPKQADLSAPFPEKTRLLRVLEDDNGITLVLSDHFTMLSGVDRSVACACIAKTVIGISDCKAVTILAGEENDPQKVDITLPADHLLLEDSVGTGQEG